MLKEAEMMEELDFKTYVDLFNNMSNFLHRPDLILYLDIEPEEALRRVNERSRGCESGLTLEYLQDLRKGYEEWLEDVKDRIPVIRLDWNTYQDHKKIADIIRVKLSNKKGLVV